MFSADLMPPDWAPPDPAPEPAAVTLTIPEDASPARHELVVIDGTLPDLDQLVESLTRTDPTRSVDIVVLDPAMDGFAQVTDLLATRASLDALHIVSHGSPGAIRLGDVTLDTAGLDARAGVLTKWHTAFRAGADILLYGCDLAGNPDGVRFMETLGALTGTDVAASEDPTGASALGGDWDLEVSTGFVATASILGVPAWNHLLAETASDAFAYATGNLDGQNGGSGWADAWNVSGSATTVAAGSLSDPGGLLPSSGGKVELAPSSPLSPQSATRNLSTAIGTDGTTQWIGFLITPGATTALDSGGIVFGDSSGKQYFLGYWGSSFVVSKAGGTGLTNVSGISVTTGQTYFLAARIDFASGNDTVTLYVNPTPGLDNPDSAFTASRSNADLSTFTQIKLLAAGGLSGNTVGIDGFRVGSTFLDVAPSRVPSVGLDASPLAYTEGDGAQAIDAALTVTNDGSTPLTGATVTVTANYVNGVDVLDFNNANPWGITGTWTAATGVLSLSGTASAADYQAALRSVTFEATGDSPGTSTRTVSLAVTDGTTTSAAVTRDVGVSAVNDAPTITAPASVSGTEDTTVTFSAGGGNAIVLADADAGTSAVQLQLTATQGLVTFSTTTGLSFLAGDGTQDSSIIATGTVSALNAALEMLRFDPASDSSGTASIVVQVNDLGNTGSGGALTDSGTISVTLGAANDPPVNTVPGSQNTAQDTPLAFSAATGNGLSVSDVDAGAGSLQITLTASNGTVALGTTTGLGTVSGNGSATLIISGTVSALNAALDTLVFTPTTSFSGTAGLTMLTDDQGNTGAGGAQTDSDAITIAVSADLPPVVATTGTTLSVNENDAATAIDAALTVSDADDATLEGATVRITTNYVTGEDVLDFASQSGITGTFNAGTGTLTLTGTASVANYQTALRSVTYRNTSDAPTLTVRTIAFTARDANADSGSATRAVQIGAVNDPPSVTVPAGQVTLEDTPLVFSTGTGNGISVADVDAGVGSVRVTLTVTNGTLTLSQTTGLAFASGSNASASMTVDGTVSAINAALNGLLFQPTANMTGGSLLSVQVSDLGNTGTGGALTALDTVDISITAVNDAPVGSNNTVTATEDTAYVFTAADFGFTDPLDATPNALAAVRIGSLPAAGSLSNAGTPVSAGDTVSVADIDAGNLRFIPVSQASGTGYASFTFRVQDDGGTADGGVNLDATARTMTVNVTAVNDAPDVSEISAPETFTEDVALDLTDIVVDDADSATLTVTLTLSDLAAGTLGTGTAGTVTSTFSAGVWSASGDIADLNSLLAATTFTPAADYATSFSVAVSVSDGVAAAVTGTKAFTATPVNDAPVITSDGGGATAAVAISENTTAVTSVTASDIDTSAGSFTFSLTGAPISSCSRSTAEPVPCRS